MPDERVLQREAPLRLDTQESVVLDEKPWGYSVRFSQDGKTLASFHGNRIKIWDVTDGRRLCVLRHDGVNGVKGGVFLTGKTQILSDSEVGDNHLCLWDYGLKESQPSLVRKFAMHDVIWGELGIAVDPRTNQIAVAGILGVQILDPASLAAIRTWKGHAGDVDSVAYASHSNTLASSGSDGLLRLWDATNFHSKLSLPAPRGHSTEGLSFVGDDSALCLVDDGLLRVWQIARKAEVTAAGW